MRESPNSLRISALIFAGLLALSVSPIVRQWRANYWLLKDGQWGTATVTGKVWGGHGAVNYRYVVDGKEYTGVSGENHRDPRFTTVQTWVEAPVLYSASHPGLSSLDPPDHIMVAFPVVLVISVVEVFLVMTIVNPKSRWAIGSDRAKARPSAH
jgi:hypothetical protein